MSSRLCVVLLGYRGVAGRMHARMYRDMHVRVIGIDSADGLPAASRLQVIPWSEVIVDVCTPTAAHVESLAWAYAQGARQFIVEKPAADNLCAWRNLLPSMPFSRVFITHPYLFSEGFRRALDLLPDIVRVEVVFNKDREHDDGRGRGRGADGCVPHVLHIEAPHQFAMLLAISPSLVVVGARTGHYGMRGPSRHVPLDCTVHCSDEMVGEAMLSTDLRARRERTLRLAGSNGCRITVHFPTTPDLVTRIERSYGNGAPEVVFSGRDDLLRCTLTAALSAMRSGCVPFEASTRFASLVLGRIDDALHLLSRDAREDAETGYFASHAAVGAGAALSLRG